MESEVEAAIVVNKSLANQFARAVDVQTRFDDPGKNFEFLTASEINSHWYSEIYILSAEPGEFLNKSR